jgi:hypothetical protein
VLLAVLNGLASDVGAGAHVLGPRALRLGPVSIALTAGPDDLSGMSDVYDALLASRTALAMRRGAALEEIPTIGLAALVATKLTRKGDRPRTCSM